jgi:hypothetical protein
MRRLVSSAFVVVLASGCGGSSSSGSFTDGGAGSSGGGSGSGGITIGGTINGDDGGIGCSDAAKLVYVLSAENDLYSFDPPSKTFTKKGTLGCQTSMSPNSMAVSRDAVAWVNYTSDDDSTGGVFQVSTSDASCTATSITLGSGWTRLGMGFSSDAANSSDETLYVAATGSDGVGFGLGGGSLGLGEIDLTSKALTPIGPFTGSLAGQSAELTGTGTGLLYGFFTGTPVQVAQIDKSSGATSNAVTMTGVEQPNYWAFSFWGGDFYLYTCNSDPSRTTNVTHYSPATGTIDTSYMTNIGFRIVGAGVSTCAPTVQPVEH